MDGRSTPEQGRGQLVPAGHKRELVPLAQGWRIASYRREEGRLTWEVFGCKFLSEVLRVAHESISSTEICPSWAGIVGRLWGISSSTSWAEALLGGTMGRDHLFRSVRGNRLSSRPRSALAKQAFLEPQTIYLGSDVHFTGIYCGVHLVQSRNALGATGSCWPVAYAEFLLQGWYFRAIQLRRPRCPVNCGD